MIRSTALRSAGVLLSIHLLTTACTQNPVNVVLKGTDYQTARPTTHESSIRVVSGDTIYSLARDNNVSVERLIGENKLSAPYNIYPGQLLMVPSSGFATAQPLSIAAPRRDYAAAPAAVLSSSPTPVVKMEPLPTVTASALPVVSETPLLPPALPAAAPAPAYQEQARVSEKPESMPFQLKTPEQLDAVLAKAEPVATAPAPLTKPVEEAPKLVALTPTPTPVVKDKQAKQAMMHEYAGGFEEVPVGSQLTFPGEATAAKTVARPVVSAPAKKAVAGNSTFVWPVDGPVVSRFGPKPGGLHNDGINIAVPEGTPIHAAAAGSVVYVGNELRGYGNLLIIRHQNGWISAYAHTKEISVKRGDAVQQGDVVALVGATGNVDRAQLHFTLRQGKEAVNPERHLPTTVTAMR